MTDNPYIKKLQRARGKAFITSRHIIMLIILSGAIYAGFYFEYGQIGDVACEGECESIHSLWAWVLGFFMIFAAVIAAAAVVGGLVAFFKWSRSGRSGPVEGLMHDKSDELKD